MALVRVTFPNVVGIDADTSDPNVANLVTLTARANTALANNATYLAIVSPTQAQAIAQVGALTRQVDGIIRLLLEQFGTIADS